MTLFPQRLKGIAKLWSHRRGSTGSATMPPPTRTTMPDSTADISEHSTIVSQMELPLDLLSSSPQMGDSDSDVQVKEERNNPAKRTRGSAFETGRKIAFDATCTAKTTTTTTTTNTPINKRRELLQKSPSLRLPQHVDKFEPVDALCDFQPSMPRQQRCKRRNSIHTDTQPSKTVELNDYRCHIHHDPSPSPSESPTASPRGIKSRILAEEGSIYTVPLSNQKQRRRNSLSGPITAPNSPSTSPNTKRSSAGRVSPRRVSPRNRNSPRRISPKGSHRGSNPTSPRQSHKNLRAQLQRGYSCTQIQSGATAPVASPLTTLPPVPNLGGADHTPKHPRQQRRNSTSGLVGATTNNNASPTCTTTSHRISSPRSSPRRVNMNRNTRGSRPAFNRVFSCSHMSTEPTLPQAPVLQQDETTINTTNRNSPRPSRSSPRSRRTRPTLNRGFSCSQMGNNKALAYNLPAMPGVLSSYTHPDAQLPKASADCSMHTAPSRVSMTLGTDMPPTHPRQQRRNSLSGPTPLSPSMTVPAIAMNTLKEVDDVAPTHPRQHRRNSTGAACNTMWSLADTPPAQTPRNMNETQQTSVKPGYNFPSQLPPCTPPSTRFGLTRSMSSQNLKTAETTAFTAHDKTSPSVAPYVNNTASVPSTPPVPRTTLPRNGSSEATAASCSSKSNAGRSVSSASSPRSITMVPSTPPRPLYGARSYSAREMTYSPSNTRSPSEGNSPRRSPLIKGNEDQTVDNGGAYSPTTDNIHLSQKHHRSQRRNSCGTYCPPSPGSNNMLEYSNHTAPTLVAKTDQAPTQPSRRRRNSINGPLASPFYESYIVHDTLPQSIPEDAIEAVFPDTSPPSFSSEPLTHGNGTSPSSSIPMSPSPHSGGETRPPLWGLSRRGSDRNLMESVNEVILPLDATSRFAAGSFDVGPSHPRQAGHRQARRASMSGPTPPITPRTPMTPLTPASTMASTISSRSRSARPGLYRRASCGSFTIQSLSPYIELVSPLSFYEEKLAPQDPSRFASGCDKAHPGPPQRPSRSSASIDGSVAASSSGTSRMNVSRRGRRPCLTRRASSESLVDSEQGKSVSASTVAAAAAIRSSRRRQFTRGASCSALEFSSRCSAAISNDLRSDNRSPLSPTKAENSELRAMRGSMFSATTEEAVDSGSTNTSRVPPARILPRGTSSSALRLARQADPSEALVDAAPRQPRRASVGAGNPSSGSLISTPNPKVARSRRGRRASCSACTHEAYLTADASPSVAHTPYWTPTKPNMNSYYVPQTGESVPTLPFMSPTT